MMSFDLVLYITGIQTATLYTHLYVKYNIIYWIFRDLFLRINASFSLYREQTFLESLAGISQPKISISVSGARYVGSQTNATTGLRKLILISRYRQIARHKSKAKKPSAKTFLRNRR